MVAGEGGRYLRASRAGPGPRRRLRKSAASDTLERQGGTEANHFRLAVRLPDHRQLRQPVCHPRSGGCDLHRDAWHNQQDESGGYCRSRNRKHRSPAQQGGRSFDDVILEVTAPETVERVAGGVHNVFVNKGMISSPAFHLFTVGLVWLSWTGFGPALTRAQGSSQEVKFNRDIRPILSDTCFTCHGPDKSKRITQLRFDTEAGAFADLGKYRAIVPGDRSKSEMFRRISAEDESERMPPVRSGRHLSKEQIELIGRWIDQGAKWQKHWSFIPPERPDP